jgi:putative membrane protein
VLADRGINDVVPADTWDGVVRTVTDGLRSGDTCNALCKAIERCGQLLEEHFPVKTDDTDELPNMIIESFTQ